MYELGSFIFWRQYTFDVMKIARQSPNLSTFLLDLELPCDLHAFFHSFRNAPCELRRFDFICYMLLLLLLHMHMLLLLLLHMHMLLLLLLLLLLHMHMLDR